MATALVTGAAGFIGAALARHLLREGHQVVTVDNLTTGRRENIPLQCHAIIADTHDPRTIDLLEVYRFDEIYHIAGQSGGVPSFDDPAYDLQANVLSTLLLLDYARRTGCPTFVYASSMAVYGDPVDLPATEESPLSPKTFYAVGKVASESYLRLYSQRGLACTALRLNNTYGPGQDLANQNQGMVSILLGQALRHGRINVRGSVDRFRDLVYIDDAVAAFVAACQGARPGAFAVYNVATAVPTTVAEILETIQSMLDAPVEVTIAGDTPGDQHGIYCSRDLISRDLNWSPQVDARDGLAMMVRWALAAHLQQSRSMPT